MLLHLRSGDRGFPEDLRTIDATPEELWARGRVGLLEPRPRVAVVGSRSPTPYGVLQAERFAGALASAGVVVVSGMARGVDAVAHRAALDAGGDTIAVVGSGVDRPWPAGPLTERVAAEGLLLSEHPPGTAPRRHHFPLRNRILAGLSRAVLVVEAAYASGSLITARWAVEQGRTVAALPGRVDQPMARGCHRLLREGALLVESPEELLVELGLRAVPCDAGPRAGVEVPPLAKALEGETLDAAELALRVGLDLSHVLARLVGLELEGWVARAPGGLWRRTSRPPPRGGA